MSLTIGDRKVTCSAPRLDMASFMNCILLMAGVAGVVCAFVPVIGTEPNLNAAVRMFCSHSCHQIPNRCYMVSGVRMPICARCLGLYAGFASAAFITLTACRKANAFVGRFAGFFVVLLVVDWLLAQMLFPSTPNILRTMTGFAGGMGLSSVFTRVLTLTLPMPGLSLRFSLVAEYITAMRRGKHCHLRALTKEQRR